ncbi:putative O-methyltransferase 3 [Forsythia ovata]|uniref:O-methyltransferase 3 n=1 Tax=Forsythia ovata TaxID=205694 RepID=A0ABD1UWK4_9LAMI
MSSRSKRHRSKTSVKLVEIVELSGSESDVPDDNVGSDVPNNTAGIEGDIVERVGRKELETEIGPGCDNAGNGNDRDKSGNDVVDNVGDKSDNARVDNIEDESDNVGDKSDNAESTSVLEFEANADCNIEVDWEGFLDNHQEDIWNSWEDGFGMNNEENNQHGGESEEYEVQTKGLQEEMALPHGGEKSTELLNAQAHVWNHIFNFINSMSLKFAVQLGILPQTWQTNDTSRVSRNTPYEQSESTICSTCDNFYDS